MRLLANQTQWLNGMSMRGSVEVPDIVLEGADVLMPHLPAGTYDFNGIRYDVPATHENIRLTPTKSANFRSSSL